MEIQKNKVQMTGGRAEKDISDYTEVIEFSHMSQEMKETCIKIAKQEYGIIFLIKRMFLIKI